MPCLSSRAPPAKLSKDLHLRRQRMSQVNKLLDRQTTDLYEYQWFPDRNLISREGPRHHPKPKYHLVPAARAPQRAIRKHQASDPSDDSRSTKPPQKIDEKTLSIWDCRMKEIMSIWKDTGTCCPVSWSERYSDRCARVEMGKMIPKCSTCDDCC
jgi:hypothetical protein